MKHYPLLLLSFLFFQTSVSQNFDGLEFGTDSTLEIISWNIEWFPNNENTTPGYIEEIIYNLNADIFALQEIDDTTLLKQSISNIPGYECYFKSNWYGGLAFVYNTNAIEVVDQYEIYSEEPYWNIFPRSPQVMEFMYLNEKHFIINNHLKCCGDETIDFGDESDEEYRRLLAMNLLKEYVDSMLTFEKVIITGDLNDNLNDQSPNNVFQSFLEDNENYLFADMEIALGSSNHFSYPTWPSHLDHILISNEFFNNEHETNTILLDQYMNNWYEYESNISDHRPVAWKCFNNNKQTFLNEQFILPQIIRTNDQIIIQFESLIESDAVLYNVNGKKVKRLRVSGTELIISTNNLNNAIYYLNIISLKKVIVIPIL